MRKEIKTVQGSILYLKKECSKRKRNAAKKKGWVKDGCRGERKRRAGSLAKDPPKRSAAIV